MSEQYSQKYNETEWRTATMTRPAASIKTSPPTDARTIVYCRVSTERQTKDDRASLDDQQRECTAFAAGRGRAVDYVWIDPGISGRDEERLERLTAWCEAHPRRNERGLIVCLNAS